MLSIQTYQKTSRKQQYLCSLNSYVVICSAYYRLKFTILNKRNNLDGQKTHAYFLKFLIKELSPCHKLWIYNPYFFGTQCRKSLILSYIIWSYIIHSLKYLRSTTLESKDIVFRKAEFVAKTQYLFLYLLISFSSTYLSLLSFSSKLFLFLFYFNILCIYRWTRASHSKQIEKKCAYLVK